ncbi:MAG: ArsR family transcriptional regulator [Candidatus Thorarchaeota archaeon]
MTEDIDDIKRELDEVRRLKEELRREVEDVRREKEDTLRRRAEVTRERARHGKAPRAPRAPRRVRPVRDIDIDIGGITDSLEDMMEGLGKSIEMSIKDVEGIGKSIRIPGLHVRRASRKGSKPRRVRKKDIEKIPPERVAKIVAPLGSEERLRILQFLKEGGKTFNEIEIFTEKTGSSLTHHLNPLVEASYVVKGEVRGTYYLTVEGRLAYRLAQWLTHRVERQRDMTGNNGTNGEAEITVAFEEEEDDEEVIIVEDEKELEKAAQHLERVAEEIEQTKEQIEEAAEELEEAKVAEEERLEDDDLDSMDWKD